MKKRTIVFVDNDRTLFKNVVSGLSSVLYNFEFFSNALVCHKCLDDTSADVVVMNVRESSADRFANVHMDIISKATDSNIKLIIIMDVDNQVVLNEFYQMGVYYVFSHSVDFSVNQLIYQIKNAIDLKLREEENLSLQIENISLKKNLANLYPFVGYSKCVKEAKERIHMLAQAEEDVFILGETGTGKEVAAYHYYLNSPRFAKPFQTVNCSALTETLIESELFGHTKGAYTDADKHKTGFFEKCNEGVLFLDEISNLSIISQSKILRAIENKEIQVVGGELKKIDTKLIFASNISQKQLISPNVIRQDLYYRIEGNLVVLAPLRERENDIIHLMSFFFSSFSPVYQGIEDLLMDLQDNLMTYSWPGNIRELKNFCKFVLLNESDINKSVIVKHMDKKLKSRDMFDGTTHLPHMKLKEAMSNYERDYLRYHLCQNNWRLCKTADKLGIERTTLYKKMKLYKLSQIDSDENFK